jgi:hypothetical protein
MAVAGRSVLRGGLTDFEPQMQASNPMMPLYAAGGNAVVFCGTLAGARKGARFFTADPGPAQERYRAIHAHVEAAELDAVTGFEWLDGVIEMGASTHPCVLMDWIEGATLDKAIMENIQDGEWRGALVDRWVSLGHDLRRAEVAHGDLQHGNVMVDSGGALRLVDLDGMWIPALAATPPNEIGHPNYQHPQRSEYATGAVLWGPDLDAFSWLVIFVSLASLAEDPTLWREHHTGTNLIFDRSAFADPDSSAVWDRLDEMSRRVVAAARLLRSALERPPEELTLDEALATAATHAQEAPPRPTDLTPTSGPSPPESEGAFTDDAWWQDDDEGDWWIDEPRAGSGPHSSPGQETDAESPNAEPIGSGDDLAPAWTSQDTSWVESETSSDFAWGKERTGGPGEIVHPVAGRPRRRTTAIAVSAVIGLIGVYYAVSGLDDDEPRWGLVVFGAIVATAGVAAVIRLARTEHSGGGAPDRISWDAAGIRIGSTWYAGYAELRVERLPGGALRFQRAGQETTVDWLSTSETKRLVGELQTHGVEVTGGRR